MVTPEGYRKVQRLAHTASRLGVPIVTFIDTKGADPGITSEEHAQSEAIASCLYEFTERAGADRCNDHRRRRQRRRARAWNCRPRHHARAFRLLGRVAGRLRRDSLGRCRKGGRGGDAVETNRRGSASASASSTKSFRNRSAVRIAKPRRRLRKCSMQSDPRCNGYRQ